MQRTLPDIYIDQSSQFSRIINSIKSNDISLCNIIFKLYTKWHVDINQDVTINGGANQQFYHKGWPIIRNKLFFKLKFTLTRKDTTDEKNNPFVISNLYHLFSMQTHQ